MTRRFVNLIVGSFTGHHPASTLHRINPWRCFYPTTQEALAAAEDTAAANNRPIMEDARLPPAAISFYKSYEPYGGIHFASLGSSSNDIISTDQDGNTLLYAAAARAIRVMPMPHEPKYAPVSITVGDGLYFLNRNPLQDHPFEALVHHPRDQQYISTDYTDEKWYWRPLPPPPYTLDRNECGKVEVDEEHRRLCYERNGKGPYVIGAYTVVGDQIWISTEGGGTFSFDTTSGLWSKAGNWALPFYGHVEYVPEHALWFGFTSECRQLAACDLGAAMPTRPPVVHTVWDELTPPLPPRWVPIMAFLLPLGGGKLCVARLFDLAEEGWCREKSNRHVDVDSFVVFTGVEIGRGSKGALSMIRHKSRRYSLGRGMAELL
ncbi:hypothetical protein SEVIR_2G074500v4 [Setaria viridis]|uniref:Uncharacterized protein n=2 Tax=Setaria TaxID=4554 RepID=K4A151_SETIT|nr:uncharacterized protein LOC111256358 [Setaria italica]XP_034583217.1 uncharacterized protein LOC117846203 [Setaria viridis]XP_034583218.1 uncharacterized protein LOC117846203 [Setaria viridis]RCV09949.1 hypothetical protein SETIT_2G071800v2 [Setaria italica]TKW30973.1 hypothetical protein SEVIR_2G074500v2 [Setaria viridis]